jgi:hypothetical protein
VLPSNLAQLPSKLHPLSVCPASVKRPRYQSSQPASSKKFLRFGKPIRNAFLSEGQLTRFALLNLFCCDGENEKYLDHDLHHNFLHFCGRLDIDINFESSEEVFDALEEVDKQVLISADSRSCLKTTWMSRYQTQILQESPHRKKDANSREYRRRGGECLLE